MDTVFEALFFLAVGLIAITVTVFVLAVSLLGRAIKLSMQEQAEFAEKGKIEIEVRIKEINRILTKAKQLSHTKIEELHSSLSDLEKQQQKHKRNLNWIKNKPALLRVGGGVLIPGSFFLISTVISIIARYIMSLNQEANMIGYLIFSIGFIIFGLFVVIQSLKVIGGVAITSEETALIREAEAIKNAMLEIEESKKPIIQLDFLDTRFPLHLKMNSVNNLIFRVNLVKGDYADDVKIMLALSPGCTFISKDIKVFPESHIYSKYELYIKSYDKLLEGPSYDHSIDIQTSNITGEFKLLYWIYCRGFRNDATELKIFVE
jgi:hypothetical protein